MENENQTPPQTPAPGLTSGLDPEPPRYEFVELFGHNCLGPCEVREVSRYGATFCEARPLKQDGTVGASQLIAGSAIYRVQPLSEQMAKLIAARRLGYVPLALPAVSETGGDGTRPDPPDGDKDGNRRDFDDDDGHDEDEADRGNDDDIPM
ncbi:MAG TPA: hypothetical protein PKV97_01800 [Thauera aminoaromatica]|nr:hypothetical protein [Thauera aminoaromatica]